MGFAASGVAVAFHESSQGVAVRGISVGFQSSSDGIATQGISVAFGNSSQGVATRGVSVGFQSSSDGITAQGISVAFRNSSQGIAVQGASVAFARASDRGGSGVSVSFGTVAPTPAELQITLNHSGNFKLGQQGATYAVLVSDAENAGAVSGAVTVTENVPTGLTLVSMVGAGWACTGDVCSRKDAVSQGQSYPPITVTVNVSSNAPSQVSNSVSVSGGGSLDATISNTTIITSDCSFAVTPGAATYLSGGGTGLVGVTAPGGCSWTATSSTSWLKIIVGDSGTGNGTVNYSVDSTRGPARSGMLTIGGQTFTVTEGGPLGPVINNITPVLPLGSQTITVTGSGFGKLPAFSGDSVFIRVTDMTAGWNAGNATDSPADGLTLVVKSWSDSQIVLSGFGSQYGSPWKLRIGDVAMFQVWNPQSGSGPATLQVTVGQPAATTVPSPGTLTFTNPWAIAANAPAPSIMATDGASAVEAVYRSSSQAPVTFQLNGTSPASLSAYYANYQIDAPSGKANQIVVTKPASCDDNGACLFLALVWPPASLPTTPDDLVAGNVPVSVTTVSATQAGVTAQNSLTLYPPPLLLVHGIWSSPKGAGFETGTNATGFAQFIQGKYPHSVIVAVDYGAEDYLNFSDPSIQAEFSKSLANALSMASAQGFAARTVDVVAHSMGGLVTRSWLSQYGLPVQSAPMAPVNKLITIGTPHDGTPFADLLYNHQGQEPVTLEALAGFPFLAACEISHLLNQGICTLGYVFQNYLKNRLDSGVLSMESGKVSLPSQAYDAIIGVKPLLSQTNALLNSALLAYLPGNTVDGTVGTESDTIVPESSQGAGAANQAIVLGVVHEAVSVTGALFADTSETQSPDVWDQVLYWLSGGTGTPSSNAASRTERPLTAGGDPQPILDLTGYTQVDASNAAIAPAANSGLTIDAAANLTATSSTKTIAELLLIQSVADPADVPMYYATQAPFSILYTPVRLGTANFVAFVLFTDLTYSAIPLTYALLPGGTATELQVMDAPESGLSLGTSVTVHTSAIYPNGPIDVTQAATYTTASGTQNVFSVSTSGLVTAQGPGIDWLDVSYGGLTASAQVPVGSCAYTVSPANQLVPSTGGVATIPVDTTSGCAWTAGGGDSWLSFSHASGSGSGAISLIAEPNATGDSRVALVTLGNQTAMVTQPATACSYSVNPGQIDAPSSGVSGTFAIATSCPIVAVSSDSWVTLTVAGTSVSYTVAANGSSSPRSAVLTIGTQSVAVTQSSGPILSIGSYHSGSFFPGETGATYLITVTIGGTGSTSGTITVADGLPSGFTATAIGGAGWHCTLAPLVCSRSDALSAGASYPLTVTVTVPNNLAGPVSNQVALSSGGVVVATASDPTTILAFSPCDVNQDDTTTIADVQQMVNEALGMAAAGGDLNQDGSVNVVDVQIVINSVLSQICSLR